MTEKKFKYYFNGEGFNSKQKYWNAVAVSYLNDSGKQKVAELSTKSVERLMERNAEEGVDKQYKKLCIGYRNSDEKKLSPEFDKVASTLEGKGFIEVVIYTFVTGGAIIQHASAKLAIQDLTSAGSDLVGNKLVSDVEISVDSPVEYGTAINNSDVDEAVKTIISEDIDVTD